MLSDAGRMIEETAERIFAAHCAPEQLKAAEDSWSAELWAELAEAGMPLALEPGGAGELGLPVADALNLVRLAGRHAAPVPLAETLLANWLARGAGLTVDEAPVSLAGLNDRDRLSLEPIAGGWRLSGQAHRVPWARCARLLAVVEHGGRSLLAVAEPGAFSVTHGLNKAGEPRDLVRFEAVLGEAEVAESPRGRKLLKAQAAAMRALQIAGALERVLDMTVRYAGERVQFGRPIGKFQAIQQNIAVMGGQVAAARAAANGAPYVFEDAGAYFALAAAKIRAGEAAGIVARHAHQVHGAIGFTQDYPLHFLTRRLWSWRDEFGDEAYWSRRLGEAVCRRGADALWSSLTAGLAGEVG